MSIEKFIFYISLIQILLSNTNLFFLKIINEILLITFSLLMIKKYQKKYLIFIFLIVSIISFELIKFTIEPVNFIQANQLKILLFIFLSFSISIEKFKIEWFRIFMNINIFCIVLSIIGIDLSYLYPLKYFVKESAISFYDYQSTLFKTGGLFLNHHVNSFALGLYAISIIQTRKLIYSLLCSLSLLFYLKHYGTDTAMLSFLITSCIFFIMKFTQLNFLKFFYLFRMPIDNISLCIKYFKSNSHYINYLILLTLISIIFYSSLNYQIIFDLIDKLSITNNSLEVILYQLKEYLANGFSQLPLFPKIHQEYINLKYVNSTEIAFVRIFSNYGLFLGTFIIYKLISLRWYSVFILLTLLHYSYFYIPFFFLFIRISNLESKIINDQKKIIH